jgi:hypothetical protein
MGGEPSVVSGTTPRRFAPNRHVLVVNAAGLHRILTEYAAYYMRSRTHLALGKDTPATRPVTPPSAGSHCRHSRDRRPTLPLRPHRGVTVVRVCPSYDPVPITYGLNSFVLRWACRSERLPSQGSLPPAKSYTTSRAGVVTDGPELHIGCSIEHVLIAVVSAFR